MKEEIFIMVFDDKGPHFCVEFWDLSHLTCEVSEAEKKITFVTS